MLKVLDLFSGIGGFSLGLERSGGFVTSAFCEIDPFCQKILKKHWPDVPIFDDIKGLNCHELGKIDVITGGYPCQPFSVAGKQKGHEDDRHLWPSMFEIIAQCRPSWVICENVYGHVKLGLDAVLFDLESEGYATATFVVPAVAVDAPHRRDRLWIVAHSSLEGRQQKPRRSHGDEEKDEGRSEENDNKLASYGKGNKSGEMPGTMANTKGEQSVSYNYGAESGHSGESKQGKFRGSDSGSLRAWSWPAEPAVGRVADGIPRRVDRLRALGNAVVPQIVERIGRSILEAEKR